jgi:hypothetical protein
VDAYKVLVRNEMTGETEIVRTAKDGICGAQAQVEALLHLFKNKGWRKAVAFQPEVADGTPIAEPA